MYQWLRRTVAGAAFLIPASAVFAQASPQPPPEVQQWIEEIQQIQTQLRPIQEQALQDPALQEEQAVVTDAVRQAIIEADSSMAGKLERMEKLTAEARAAQEAGDTQKIGQLTTEAETLQPEIIDAQAAALEKPEIEAQVTAFQENLHERMAQLDPKSKPLIDKMKQLDQRVRKAMGAG
jgi:hypothetical protein